jgi:serine kinase of HPr protein (carbohydrate metabolism regulator)
MIVHAGLLARRSGGDWRGVLVRGPSGSGKSDLALRALDDGWTLVADDRVLLWISAGRLFGRAPDTLTGLIEARGLGVLPSPGRDFVGVDLVVHCAPAPELDRMPEPRTEALLGVGVPTIRLAALEASAPAKLGRALSHLGVRPQPAYQTSRAGEIPAARGGVV